MCDYFTCSACCESCMTLCTLDVVWLSDVGRSHAIRVGLYDYSPIVNNLLLQIC